MSLWTSLVVRVDGASNGRGSLESRVAIADTTAAGLTTASWVDDGFGVRAGVGVEDGVHNAASGSITGSNGRFTGTEDMDAWARLSFVNLWGCQGELGEEKEGTSCCKHLDCFL